MGANIALTGMAGIAWMFFSVWICNDDPPLLVKAVAVVPGIIGAVAVVIGLIVMVWEA